MNHHHLKQDRSSRNINCTHGGPPPRGKKTQEKIAPRITSCMLMVERVQNQFFRINNINNINNNNNENDPAGPINIEEVGRQLRYEWTNVVLQTLNQFWSPYYNDNENSNGDGNGDNDNDNDDVDEDYIKMCFSAATDATLDGDFDSARYFVLIAMYLTSLIGGEGEAAAAAAAANQISTTADEKISKELAVQKVLYKTRTDRGLILFLHNKTKKTCTCLDESANIARSKPKTGKCCYCKSQSEKIKLKHCSRCQAITYCSKDCQKKDWSTHKSMCRAIKSAKKNSEKVSESESV